jgi:hypothetical protein
VQFKAVDIPSLALASTKRSHPIAKFGLLLHIIDLTMVDYIRISKSKFNISFINY